MTDRDFVDKDKENVGTGVGAVTGGAAGAAAGAAIGGPVGAVVGGAAGAVAGGLAGRGIAKSVDPKVEDDFWRANYMTRPYYTSGEVYEVYEPAYRFGWESYTRYDGRSFEEVEQDLERDWNRDHAGAKLSWERAKRAVRDAWHKIERALPGDFDKDGR